MSEAIAEADVAPGLLELLRKAGDEYGPLGVALVAASLTDERVLLDRLRAQHDGMPEAVEVERQRICSMLDRIVELDTDVEKHKGVRYAADMIRIHKPPTDRWGPTSLSDQPVPNEDTEPPGYSICSQHQRFDAGCPRCAVRLPAPEAPEPLEIGPGVKAWCGIDGHPQNHAHTCPDEDTIERMARRLSAEFGACHWEHLTNEGRARWAERARAALAAVLPPARPHVQAPSRSWICSESLPEELRAISRYTGMSFAAGETLRTAADLVEARPDYTEEVAMLRRTADIYRLPHSITVRLSALADRLEECL